MSANLEQPINPDQGLKVIQKLLGNAHLQRVTASKSHADRLLKQAQNHLFSAGLTASNDPEGAYASLYDAARKSLVAVLEVQGLRPTSKGGHIVIYEALVAQFDPPHGDLLSTFNRIRKWRNGQEYPKLDEPELTSQDVLEDLEKSQTIVELAVILIHKILPPR